MRRDIVFLHIPKTAGTALRNALIRGLSGYTHLFDYGPKQKLTSAVVRELAYEGENRLQDLRQHVPRDRPILLTGHILVARYRDVFASDSFIAFVREPVGRVLSDYKHFVRHYGYGGTVLEFARLPQQRNKQWRALSGTPVETLGFVGVVEEFEEELGSLCAVVGADLDVRRENVAPAKQVVEIDEATRRAIESLNASDVELYERVQRERGVRRNGVGYAGRAKGTMRQLEDGSIRGWAVAEEGRRIVVLDVYEGDVWKGRVEACSYRPDLVRRGLSVTGIGGFRFLPAEVGIEQGPVTLRSGSLELRLDQPVSQRPTSTC